MLLLIAAIATNANTATVTAAPATKSTPTLTECEYSIEDAPLKEDPDGTLVFLLPNVKIQSISLQIFIP